MYPGQASDENRQQRNILLNVAAALPAIVVSVLSSAVFVLPPQILDIYRDIAQYISLGPEDPTIPRWQALAQVWSEPIVTVLAALCLAAVLWITAKSFLASSRQNEAFASRAARQIRTFLPTVVAVVPILALALGLISARVDSSAQERVSNFLERTYFDSVTSKGVDKESAAADASSFAKKLGRSNAILVYLSLGGLTAAALLSFIFYRINSQTADRAEQNRASRTALNYYALITAIFIIAMSVGIARDPLTISTALPPLALFCLFCILVLMSANILSRYSEVTGFPMLTILIVLAIVFSTLGLNDNHQVRYEKALSEPKPLPVPNAQAEFLTWLSSREDLARFEADVPYPIYIVAAQGGGAYAGLYTAVFLSSAQQLCPNFTHHLFAISSVSGGSVGAAVFSAIMREAEREGEVKLSSAGCNQVGEGSRPNLVEASIAVMGKDFWGPLQASLLFPDFLQRFLPWPVPQFDRALALEKALEKAWREMPTQVRFGEQDMEVQDFLSAPYPSHWQPKMLKHSPALLLNTTEIQSGNRRLIAPFEFKGAGGLQFLPLQDTRSSEPTYLPLSTAAILSARFPWVTPYGWIFEQAKKKDMASQIVDGGYFENSGAATAMDLIKDLIPALHSFGQKVEINLIILTSEDFAPPATVSGETLGPIQAMLNTRSARASIEIDRAKLDLQSLSSERVSMRAIEVKLQGLGYPLPLGWRLSTMTRYLIEYQKGLPTRCSQKHADGRPNLTESADCAKELIFKQLAHLH